MRHPFLKTLAASPRDPNFENVILSMHGDGTNGAQSLTFLDDSTNNHTVLVAGNAYQGTFSPFGDNWSNYFDGVDDYLSLTGGALGTSQFCVELWYYPTVSSTNSGLYDGRTTNLSSTGILIRQGNNSGSATTIDLIVGATTISKSGLVINSWNHIAICRNASNTTNVFVNGSAATSATISTNLTDTGVRVGAFVAASGSPYAATGYVSNLRVVIGSSVYDPTQSTLTVPTAPLTAITNTSLLTCSTNRFRDVSSNNRTITRNGDVRVQRFSPFSPAAGYSAAAIGGSARVDLDLYGYFEFAAGLSSFSMAASDFSFEAWVYRVGTGDSSIFTRNENMGGPSESSYRFIVGSTTSEVYSGSSSYSVTSPNPAIGQWAHVAWARTGGTFSSYLNGTRVGTIGTRGTSSLNVLATAPLYIGEDAVLNLKLDGYISGARIIKGSGGYDATSSTITVPTAPPTAVTNTQLLLNFTNAGIVDSAAMGDVLTNNDAKLNTTTKKYGTGSIQFDGTGDNIEVFHTIDQLLGTGAFTIEMWVYRNVAGVAHSLIAKGGSTTGWYFSINASNAVVFTYGTSTITSTTTIAATTWTHIAVVREGTGTNQTKIYINGTNDGTGTVATDFTQTNHMFIGCSRSGLAILNGYLDDIRITKGVARYTANFTAPTAAFPDL